MDKETGVKPLNKFWGLGFLFVLAGSSTTYAQASARDTGTYVPLTAKIIQTSKAGNKLDSVNSLPFSTTAGTTAGQAKIDIRVYTGKNSRKQKIDGFGGSLTESSASTLLQVPANVRKEVIQKFFSPTGLNYNLARVHIASCDFSLRSYTYSPTPDLELTNFSVNEDIADVIPLIKDAMAASGNTLQILGSPWTAPPWMKDTDTFFVPRKGNTAGRGGKLKPEYYGVYAKYLSKFISAYKDHGIPIWALTPVNEPLGNDGQWESMEFKPGEMATFVGTHLGPQLAADGYGSVKLFMFDHNKNADFKKWADTLFQNPKSAQYATGMAAHWYAYTVNVAGDILDQVHNAYPTKTILATEATIDALGDGVNMWWGQREERPIGVWMNNDKWWWEKNHSDWGFVWAEEKKKPDHPKVEAVYRVARDIIGDLNHWTTGWIDWNIVLDSLGGPNHKKNYCAATVMINTSTKKVYYTPLFYTMGHFSKFIQRNAQVLENEIIGPADSVKVTAAINPDSSISVVLLNMNPSEVTYNLKIGAKTLATSIPGNSIQTLLVGGENSTNTILKLGNVKNGNSSAPFMYAAVNNQTINVTVDREDFYRIHVFNVNGVDKGVLFAGSLKPGTHALNTANLHLMDGVYFIKTLPKK